MDEKNNKSSKRGEECPLCKVSEETLQKLKKKEDFSKKAIAKPKKKSSGKFKLIVFIFVVGLIVIAFYKLSPNFTSQSLQVSTPTQEQTAEEKNQAKILDVLPKALKVGDSAPDFTTEDVDGNKISLSDFQDKKPVLLIFWATWCGYCAMELPLLKAFTQEHQNEIQVITVSSGEKKETIRNYIQEKDVNFLMLLDEKREIWQQYFIRGTPSHFLIDSGGKIIALRPGLALKENLENLLTILR